MKKLQGRVLMATILSVIFFMGAEINCSSIQKKSMEQILYLVQ